jgi:HAMP domain-containing protein
MKTSFRTRLFRLLLLFAVLPAIVIGLVGYYLAIESPLQREAGRLPDPTALSDYYHDRLTDKISLAIEAQVGAGNHETLLLDFLLLIDSSAVRQVTRVPWPPDAPAMLQQASERKASGMVQIGSAYFQYVRRQYPGGVTAIGGLRHDSTYGAMLEAVRHERGARTSLRELRGSYVLFLGGLFLVVMAATVASAFWLSRRATRRMAEPLSALSEAATRIAAGDFSQLVTARGEGEIASLIENFNRMTSALDHTTRQLAQAERVAAWRQVARRFAHELKNPLQPILVSLYRIEKQLKDTEVWDTIKEPLAATAEEVRHLTTLAERFSTLAKLPAPRMELRSLTELTASVAS